MYEVWPSNMSWNAFLFEHQLKAKTVSLRMVYYCDELIIDEGWTDSKSQIFDCFWMVFSGWNADFLMARLCRGWNCGVMVGTRKLVAAVGHPTSQTGWITRRGPHVDPGRTETVCRSTSIYGFLSGFYDVLISNIHGYSCPTSCNTHPGYSWYTICNHVCIYLERERWIRFVYP